MTEAQQYIPWMYQDQENGNICVSNGLTAFLYTTIATLTIVFFVCGHQIIISREKESIQAQEEFERSLKRKREDSSDEDNPKVKELHKSDSAK